MSPEMILLINGLIVFVVVVALLSAHSRRKPTQLHMKSGSSYKEIGEKERLEARDQIGPQEDHLASGDWQSSENGDFRSGKELTVQFNYNGHSFDAFEVLGIPAGSSLDKARKAHKEMLRDMSSASREFVDAALQALVKSHQR